jgi:GAF domain-containing protein
MVDKTDQAIPNSQTSSRQVDDLNPGGRPVDLEELSIDGVRTLFNELQARLVELERQNQELRRTRQNLEGFDTSAQQPAEPELARLLAAEREQRLRAETLGDIFLALTSQTSHKDVLDEILRQLQHVVSYSAANIMLLKEGVLRIVRWQGYENYGSAGLLATLEQPLAEFPVDAKVVQLQQTLVIPDTHDDPDWVALAESGWIRSFVAVPVCSQDQVLGLLRLDSDVPNSFSSQDVERLQPIANAAAIALTNARLHDQNRHELAKRNVQVETEIIQLNRKLLTLQYAGATITSSSDLQYVVNTVTKEMADMLNVASCAVYQWEQRRKKATLMASFGLGQSWREGLLAEVYSVAEFPLIQRVLVERRPQQITVSHPGVYPAELALMQQANLKTLLMIPMEFQDRVIGLVKVIDTSRERTFSNTEIGLIQLLGNQVANALENTRLYEQVQQQLTERMEIEKDLRQVAARQQAILNAIPDSMLYFSRDGKLLSYKMADNYQPLGILEKSIVTETQSQTSSTNLVDLIRHHLKQISESGKPQSFQCRLLLPEGPQHFEVRLVPSGPNEVLAMVRNVTRP